MSTSAWVSLTATILLFGFWLLMAKETALLIHRKTPVTSVIRSMILRWPARAIAIGGVVLFLLGMFFAHFFWDASLL